MIYLDNNATTRPLEPVQQAVARAVADAWCNPSSMHRAGQAARQGVELARRSLGELIGARPRFITLCGSGTEAIDLAIRGSLLAQSRVGAARKRPGGAIITTAIEHSAVRDLCTALEREEGIRVLNAPLDAHGVVRSEGVRSLLESTDDVALVSVQWANNETGAVHPIAAIGQACRSRGVVFHSDATQWVGKMPTDINDVSDAGFGGGWIDLLTYSPHKFHGPKGVGVLYARPGIRTAPLIHGEQELGRRGGTENVPGIVGSGAAAHLAMDWLREQPGERTRLASLRDRFEAGVLHHVPDAVVNGPRGDATEAGIRTRLWNTSNIGFPRLEAEALLLLLSERGLCASAGAACSSGSLDPSPVLRAMGIPTDIAHGSLRFSLSRETTDTEVAQAVEVLASCVERLRRSGV